MSRTADFGASRSERPLSALGVGELIQGLISSRLQRKHEMSRTADLAGCSKNSGCWKGFDTGSGHFFA